MAARTSKSNKTDHVLNLLAGGGEKETEAVGEGHNEEPQVDKQDSTEVPVVQSSEDEQKISEAIRDALEEELKQEQVEHQVAPEDAADAAGRDLEEEQEEEKPVAAEANVPEEVVTEEVVTEEVVAEEDFAYLNVMEYLVKDKVVGYMKQFGNCICSRCVADTTALALTRLPAKYVVINKDTVSPLLNFYENKYAGSITVEITKACIRIKEFPHHN